MSEAVEVDFANEYLGGGALRRGCVQVQYVFISVYDLLEIVVVLLHTIVPDVFYRHMHGVCCSFCISTFGPFVDSVG